MTVLAQSSDKQFSYPTVTMLAKQAQDAFACYIGMVDNPGRRYSELSGPTQDALRKTVHDVLQNPTLPEAEIYGLYQAYLIAVSTLDDTELMAYDEVPKALRYRYVLIKMLVNSYLDHAEWSSYDKG